MKVGKFPFTASGKASAAGAKDGFVKLVFDAKYGELLGAHLIGANVTEMIAELVVARKLETTGEEIIKAIHPHPTMSEAIMEAAAAVDLRPGSVETRYHLALAYKDVGRDAEARDLVAELHADLDENHEFYTRVDELATVLR